MCSGNFDVTVDDEGFQVLQVRHIERLFGNRALQNNWSLIYLPNETVFFVFVFVLNGYSDFLQLHEDSDLFLDR